MASRLRSSDLLKLPHLCELEIDIAIAEHRRADHLIRRSGDRREKRTVEWTLRKCKRLLGRRLKRCEDVFVANVSHLHPQMAESLDLRNVLRVMLEADPHHKRQLRVRETNANCAGALTTTEDGPFKYQASSEYLCDI
ncbi:hypothetical protein KIN20_007140 [Parelaphostrongylus tenuis]|uniref:Uncharacterized protein n=1 Tax=Parelaphostrongylus tenuis TaxID=148309 RepID=A0AAD5QIX4_PARTN|nr:hypothetical protein KIN20_007140 [Parelaphostrongylus tenuis]